MSAESTLRSIEFKSPSNTKSFPSQDSGPDLACSASNKFVQLVDVSWQSMRGLAHEFADELDSNLKDLLLTRSNRVRKGSGSKNASKPLKKINQSSPEALSIGVIGQSSKSRPAQVAGKYCSTPALTQAIADAGIGDRFRKHKANITPSWKVIYEPYETQRKVASAMIEPQIRSMDWTLPSSELRLAASARVLELLDQCSGTDEFLNSMCSQLLSWFSESVRKGANGSVTRGVQRPLALAWFAIWLAERGILLFPLKEIVGRGSDLLPLRYRHFVKTWLRTDSSRRLCEEQEGRLDPLLSNSIRLRDRADLLLLALNLAAPGIAFGRVCAESLSHIRDTISEYGDETTVLTAIWKIEHSRLKAAKTEPALLQQLNDLVIRSRSTAKAASTPLWAWVDDPEAKSGSRARYHKRVSIPGPNLSLHVSELRRVFPMVARGSAGKMSSNLAVWLSFLSTIPDSAIPASIVDLKPSLIASASKREHPTLLEFMALEAVPYASQRAVFAQLRKVWKTLAIQAGMGTMLCPISDQLITLPKRGEEKRPSSSTRSSIDMEILELLIEENRANDFAFSRDRLNPRSGERLDYRVVADPETGVVRKEWWPGVSAAMDLLLQIPIRHKQGRYLDSGEGDELELDIETLRLSKNTLATATKGRNQAFIQRISLSPLRDEPGLGMYVNTNKTGRDYSFPWLLVDIARNVQRVIDWQRRFNPINAPVSDRADSHEEAAALLEPIWVYPIFRDPGRSNNKPVSAQIILDYFRALLKHVEAKYNLLNNTSLSFFRPDGEPVYDIHSLRVTGVTRLLSMGVEPRIVRLLVGHSSLTMTWYYEHITNQRVSAGMRSAMEATRPTREKLLAMSQQQRESHLARLFNRSDQPLLAVSLLRGLLEERSPLLTMMLDGFCPGIRCTEAGVWRDRACSLCKYFATGPAFLAGLELRLNDLMAEIIFKQQGIAELRKSLYRTRQLGESTATLQGEISTAERTLDNVLTQWESQFQYVKKAEAGIVGLLDPGPGNLDSSETSLVLVSPNASAVGLALTETHHLGLFTSLVEGAKCVQGFVPTAGTRDARDAMLLEIARHDDKAGLFFQLHPAVRRRALDQFASMILERNPSSGQIQSLIDGTSKLDMVPGAEEWLRSLPLLSESAPALGD